MPTATKTTKLSKCLKINNKKAAGRLSPAGVKKTNVEKGN